MCPRYIFIRFEGAVAHLGERLSGRQEAESSNLSSSTMTIRIRVCRWCDEEADSQKCVWGVDGTPEGVWVHDSCLLEMLKLKPVVGTRPDEE